MSALDTIIFWGASAVAVIATALVIFGRNPFTAVLYLIISLFGVSMIFYTLGAPFLAVLEIIVYAGAIMVLFLFVVQMLSPGIAATAPPDLARPKPTQTIIPGVLALVMLGILMLAVVRTGSVSGIEETQVISARTIGITLFRHHYLGVELASLILLIGIVGGMHLGRAASDAEETEPDVAIR